MQCAGHRLASNEQLLRSEQCDGVLDATHVSEATETLPRATYPLEPHIRQVSVEPAKSAATGAFETEDGKFSDVQDLLQVGDAPPAPASEPA